MPEKRTIFILPILVHFHAVADIGRESGPLAPECGPDRARIGQESGPHVVVFVGRGILVGGLLQLGTRLMIDGTPQGESDSHFQPWTPADANANLHSNVVRNLTKKTHTAVLQWHKGGATVGSWSSAPSWPTGYVAGRTLIVMAFYQ